MPGRINAADLPSKLRKALLLPRQARGGKEVPASTTAGGRRDVARWRCWTCQAVFVTEPGYERHCAEYGHRRFDWLP
jgi:hypothetical protein